MGKGKLKNLTPLDTTVAHQPAAEGQGSEAVGLEGMGDHIEKLKQVSGATKTLMGLLGDQLQVLSATIPVLRGFDIVKELREVLKAHNEGMEGAFDPLRTHIDNQKKLFCTKNAGAIEGFIQKRVEEGVKQKFHKILNERLGRYKKYLATNGALTDGVKQAMTTVSVRTANSLLYPNYPNELVTLILPHPEWDHLTLGYLKNIGGPAVADLARTQGLTPNDCPDAELARIHNVNMMLRHLGVHYQAIPSKNGLLLISAPRQTGR